MKIKILGVFVLSAIFGSAINAVAQQGTTGTELADFEIEITVDRVANGARLKCKDGCSWESLSFSCEAEDDTCVVTIDQSGTP